MLLVHVQGTSNCKIPRRGMAQHCITHTNVQKLKPHSHSYRKQTLSAVGPPYPRVLHPQIQLNADRNYLEKSYVVADIYCVVRPRMVSSVLNRYKLFGCYYSLNNTVPQLFTQHLHCVKYYE